MIRQQTSEVRTYRLFITDDDGLPLTGLTPTASAWKASDGTALTAPTVAEVAGGFYRVVTGALTEDAVIRVDRGTAGAGRYIALEAVVGGYVDSIDATTSSRASQASVTALGSPAQAAALAAVQADTDAIQTDLVVIETAIDDLGAPAQAADWTPTRAAKVDNLDATVSSRASASALATVQADTDDLQASLTTVLTRLDVAVSTRASAADMVEALTDLDTLLARLSAVRAGLLDNLDVAVSTRATPADVTVTVSDTSAHAEIS